MAKSFWHGKRVFITGASGLLGSHMVHRLVSEGAEPAILMRDYVPSSELVKSGDISKVNVIRGELEDFELMLRALNEYEIDTVFHLGAQTIVPTANVNPLSTFRSNILGTWNLLEAARVIGRVKRIVVASTDKVYGTQEVLPYDEKMELRGIFPYEVSKVCADLLSQSYFKTYSLPVAITRCGNIYGPGDLNFSRIVPGALKAAILNETLEIRSDGKFVRDYIFMEDVIDGNLLIAQALDKGRINGEVFNLSTNNRLSVLDVTDRISKIMDRKIMLKVLGRADNEIREQYLSSDKALSVLGWKAKHSFEDGIKKTIGWYKKYFRV